MTRIKELEKTVDIYGRYIDSLLERLDEETTKRKDAEAFRARKVDELAESLRRLDNLTALAKKRGVGGYAKPEEDCGPLTEEDRELLGLDARCAKEQI